MPGALGIEVRERVCHACWQQRQAAQVMIINQYRRNLIDSAAYRELENQLGAPLGLGASPGS
jgi:Fe-S cluster biosynthesis and repair protein YggX